jgi:hypothetical protein
MLVHVRLLSRGEDPGRRSVGARLGTKPLAPVRRRAAARPRAALATLGAAHWPGSFACILREDPRGSPHEWCVSAPSDRVEPRPLARPGSRRGGQPRGGGPLAARARWSIPSSRPEIRKRDPCDCMDERGSGNPATTLLGGELPCYACPAAASSSSRLA